MIALRAENCGYRYPGAEQWAFRHISFEIASGQLLQVAGRNGSGKSTLLKVCAGELRPTEGLISYNGDADPVYMDQSARDMIAEDLTIHEQILAFSKGSRSKKSGILSDLRTFGLGLEGRSNEFIGHLSGGQKQIVALLSTMRRGTKIVCLDEFTAALDEKSIAATVDILKSSLSTDKVAILMVSHAPFNQIPHASFTIGGSE